jgi:hypothetical protein
VLLELQEEKCEMKTKKQNKKTKHLFVMVRRKAKQPKVLKQVLIWFYGWS